MAFLAPFTALPGARRQASRLSPAAAPARARRRAQARWRAQISNVEQLPLERIPATGELPAAWGRPGVYGVYDAAGALQYVAAAESVADAIEGHRQVLRNHNRVHSVRMVTIDVGAPTEVLDQFAENWVVSLCSVAEPPPGNTPAAPEWLEVPETVDVTFQGGVSEEEARMEILRLLRRHRVLLFMKGTSENPQCGFSERTVDVLRKAGASDIMKCVDCLDAVANPGLRQEIKEYAQWPTIPQLYVNGDFVGGADIVASLAESGELQAMVADALQQPVYTGD